MLRRITAWYGGRKLAFKLIAPLMAASLAVSIPSGWVVLKITDGGLERAWRGAAALRAAEHLRLHWVMGLVAAAATAGFFAVALATVHAVVVRPLRRLEGFLEENRRLGWSRGMPAWDADEIGLFARTLHEAGSELQIMLDALHRTAMVYVTDPDGRITFVNEQVRHFTGFAAEDLLGATPRLLNSGYHPPSFWRDLYASLGAGKPWRGEIRNRTKSGSLYWVDATILPVAGPDRTARCFVAVQVDITAKKMAEGEHLAIERRFETVAHSAPVLIWLIGSDLKLSFLNRFWADFTGRDATDDPERAFWDAVHPDDADALRAARKDAFLTRRAFDLEYRVLRHDGHYRVIREAGRPRFDELGLFEGFTGSGSDVTESRAAEKGLREREERLSLALFGGDLGLWDWNPVTGEMHGNEHLGLMVGLLPMEIPTRMDDWQRLVHPEDGPLVEVALEDHLQGRAPVYHSEHRRRHKDGRWIWVLCRGRVVERNRHGQAVRVVGTHLDITEQKTSRELMLRELWSKRRDLVRAEELLRSLVPRSLPLLAEAAVEGAWIPSKELSGDFFDARTSNDGRRLVVLMVDCTGHGLASAMDALLMKLLCDRHFGLAESGMLGEFLATVNREAFDYLSDDQYPTLFAGIYELATGQFHYARAASPLPLLRRRTGTVEALPELPSMPLGFDADLAFPEAECALAEDEEILLFSDGLVEVQKDGQLVRSLDDLARWYGGEAATEFGSLAVYHRLAATALGRADLDDDFAALRIRRVRRRPFRTAFRTKGEMEAALRAWEHHLAACGWSDDETARLTVAVREAGMNALEHGNRGSADRTVRMEARIDGRSSTVYVEDEGEGFAPEAVPDPADPARLARLYAEDQPAFTRGRGLFLLRRLCKSVYYHEPGNAVTLQFERDTPSVAGAAVNSGTV